MSFRLYDRADNIILLLSDLQQLGKIYLFMSFYPYNFNPGPPTPFFELVTVFVKNANLFRI